jgi:hypothetical protein
MVVSREHQYEILNGFEDLLCDFQEATDLVLPRRTRNKHGNAVKSFKLVSDCPICLESFKDDEQMTLSPCCHLFHRDCLKMVGVGRQSCPMCRAMIYVK